MTEAPWKRELGERVRGLRDERGLTRQELADRAHLSLRFLADVEGGKANPSLGSLHDLARALDVDVIALLAHERTRARPLALLGLRGAGKSTVGKRLAKQLGWPFVELDQEIEREAGMSLAELFALHGEMHYQTLEARVLHRLLSDDANGPVVLATGGGIVTHDDAWRVLRSRATTVWLKATPQEHWDRVVAQGDERPMAKRSRARAELEALHTARAPLYASADVVVNTSARGVEGCVREVIAALA
jgi:XRE family aerobic/anaerobic benzoate catabolism transcriptional regulator